MASPDPRSTGGSTAPDRTAAATGPGHKAAEGAAAGSEEDWSSRRDALAQRIAERRRAMPDSDRADGRSGGMSGLAEGLKIASEFIGGIIVGAALGWGLDQLAGTSPFGLIFFLLVGFAAGVLNVIRGVSASSTPRDGEPR